MAGATDKRISGKRYIDISETKIGVVSMWVKPMFLNCTIAMIRKNIKIKLTDKAACSLSLDHSTISTKGRSKFHRELDLTWYNPCNATRITQN